MGCSDSAGLSWTWSSPRICTPLAIPSERGIAICPDAPATDTHPKHVPSLPSQLRYTSSHVFRIPFPNSLKSTPSSSQVLATIPSPGPWNNLLYLEPSAPRFKSWLQNTSCVILGKSLALAPQVRDEQPRAQDGKKGSGRTSQRR